MCAIASGQSADAIANDLSISVHTVYSYRNRILDKLDLKTNVEITQYAIQNKLVEL
jgi:DNA-binding CsgD family transcriptional regulator